MSGILQGVPPSRPLRLFPLAIDGIRPLKRNDTEEFAQRSSLRFAIQTESSTFSRPRPLGWPASSSRTFGRCRDCLERETTPPLLTCPPTNAFLAGHADAPARR